MTKRMLCWGLLTLFVAGVIFRIMHFPFRPERVLRMLPPEAELVTRHHHPTERLDRVLTGSFSASLAALCGLTPDALDALRTDPGVETLIQRLGARYMVMGRVAPATTHDGAVVLGAWVGGGMTHAVRLGWLDNAFSGFAMQRTDDGDRVWTGFFPDLPAGLRFVSFAVYEGVLAGSMASHPFGVLPLLSRLKQNVSVSPLAAGFLETEDVFFESEDAYRVQLEVSGHAPVLLKGAVDTAVPSRISGRSLLEAATPASLPILRRGKGNDVEFRRALDSLGAWLGPVPDALVVVESVRVLEPGLMFGAGRAWNPLLRLVGDMTRTDGMTCFWVSGGKFSGHLMRLRVPAAGLAVQVDADSDSDGLVHSWMDRLNQHYKLGLVAVPDREQSFYTVTSVKGGLLARLQPTERPAVVVIDGWLIVVSSVDVMRKILTAEPARAYWMPDALQANTWGYGWGSLPALKDVITSATAGYTLYHLLQSAGSHRPHPPALLQQFLQLELPGTFRFAVGHEHQHPVVDWEWNAEGLGSR